MEQNRALNTRFRQQYGVVSRYELRSLGVTAAMERTRVASGQWERTSRRVVRVAGSPRTPEQDLTVALLEAGPAAVASHQSAAWLWGMVRAPDKPSVTMPRNTNVRRARGFVIHRTTSPPSVSFRGSIPCTNPLRTLVDLAGVVPADQLDDAVDRAIAAKLVTVEAIRAELDRLSAPGRNGVGRLRSALSRRGELEPLNPSVLESRLYRLLKQGGITPQAVEVVAGEEGQYRIDVTLDPVVSIEVDGHVYHSTPEQKAYDERRRAEIRLAGGFLLVYDWMAVTRDGRRLLKECHQALARYGTKAAKLAAG